MVPQSVKLLQASLTRWQRGVSSVKLHPMARGALTYAIMWPLGSFIQQTLEGRKFSFLIHNHLSNFDQQPETYDWARALRFSIFGALYVAPTLYGWVRLSSAMWPQTNLRIGIVKALTEQISYGPFACVSFFVGMSLLELKTLTEAIDEAKEKFLPTFKVGMCVWPFLQTINFSFVPERNRIYFVSICSLIWTCFLAYMKTKEVPHET